MHENEIQQTIHEDNILSPMPEDNIQLLPSYGLTFTYSTTPTLSSNNSKAFSKSSLPTTSSSRLSFPISSTSVTSNYRKTITVGARVKRGPDWGYWTHGNQDGGVGNLGTVVRRSTKRGYDFVVKWDGKNIQCDYRWGSQNKYELELVS